MTQIDEYCGYLVSRGRKESTVGTYKSSLQLMMKMISEKHKKNVCVQDITEDDIYFLQRELPLKEPTVRQYLMLLNGMIAHYTNNDLVRHLDLLWNRPVRNRLFITKEDFCILYREANAQERLILMLGGLMGLRRDEMRKMCVCDIKKDSIIIHGKGHGAEGMIQEQFMPKEVKIEIEHYLTNYRSQLKGRDLSGGRLLVFAAEGEIRGYAERSGRISDIVKDLGERCGIELTCHSLRRFYCTELSESGVPLEILKSLMRHANVNTTLNCYLRVDDRKSKEMVKSFSESLGNILYIPKTSQVMRTNTD